jgi:hypothetical protein
MCARFGRFGHLEMHQSGGKHHIRGAKAPSIGSRAPHITSKSLAHGQRLGFAGNAAPPCVQLMAMVGLTADDLDQLLDAGIANSDPTILGPSSLVEIIFLDQGRSTGTRANQRAWPEFLRAPRWFSSAVVQAEVNRS